MMSISDSQMKSQGYRLVYGYDSDINGTQVIDNTTLRYAHAASETYNNPANDFWVFAYYINAGGELCVSYRRHFDGSVDDDFDPETLIAVETRGVVDEIIGIYTVDGRYAGKNIDSLEHGIYIVKTTTSAKKIIK